MPVHGWEEDEAADQKVYSWEISLARLTCQT